MKKLLIIFLTLPLLFSSCNKKLKEDMEDLEKSVQEQKDQNANLQNQINSIAHLIGSDEPMSVVTTFLDDNNISRTVSATYNFKSSNYDTQFMLNNNDGTYRVYIERFGDVNWNEGGAIDFVYNPTTGAITNAAVGHYWEWNISGYNPDAYYSYNYSPAPTVNVTVNSINTTTGYVDLSVTSTAPDGYNYGPNVGKGCSSTHTFKGTLSVMNTTF